MKMDDWRIEIEYFGLTLEVRQSSAATDIHPMYNLATICITDNDSKFLFSMYMAYIHLNSSPSHKCPN